MLPHKVNANPSPAESQSPCQQSGHEVHAESRTLRHRVGIRLITWFQRQEWKQGWKYPLLHGFLREMYTLLWRIGHIRKTRLFLYTFDLGPAIEREQGGNYRWHKRTRAYTMDIESFWAKFPASTVVDLEIFREAWNMGAKWGENNCKTESESPSSLESHSLN